MPSRVLEAPPPPRSLMRDKRRVGELNGDAPSTPGSSSSTLAQASSGASGSQMLNSYSDVDMVVPSHALNNRGSSSDYQTASLVEESDIDSVASDLSDDRPVLHIEVMLKEHSRLLPTIIESNIKPLLQGLYKWIKQGTVVPPEQYEEFGLISNNVERIYIAECGETEDDVEVDSAEFDIHIYRASDSTTVDVSGGLDDDDDDSKTAAATVRELPSRQLEGLWDNLIYPDNIKPLLLNYIYSTLIFSENEVDFNVIAWNRLVLLYGPPGTGKTSLCRALAQKLSIRMSDKYTHGRLVEINSHSLFSKWFSESGKLVQRLFDTVNAMVEDPNCFVVVMIDEVESLTAARAGAMSGSEPSDALRVVNALLTQLDKLKMRKNVLVMTTSNLAGAIDPAFVDRADIKQYVGLPPAQAIYWIFSSCLRELGRAELAPDAENLLEWSAIPRSRPSEKRRVERSRLASVRLAALAERCQSLGFSGRFLRKVPLVAHARYLSYVGSSYTRGRSANVQRWIEALERAVEDERVQRELIDAADGKRAVK